VTESRIIGTVTRAGTPVADAFVWCAGPSGEFVAEVRTDPAGRYELYVVAGAWTLTAFAPGTDRVAHGAQVNGPGDMTLDFDLAG